MALALAGSSPLGNWPQTVMWESPQRHRGKAGALHSGRDRCWQSFLDPTDVWIGRVSAWLPIVSKRGDKKLAQGSGVDFGANRPNLGARLHRRPPCSPPIF